ncbi:hypothetical protein [Pontiella sulfatireligans]|uniref:Pectate lyase C n=1 Tax=Pontiella sulfatireligans TaxID=2750658 RepID=A0A6C2UI86_9BACT|nr:hypothetical protein [Pontiella sulfatireligans]VGO19838.1 hypothetical protein SCARR_01898 [Pontiella sulfatireligans]
MKAVILLAPFVVLMAPLVAGATLPVEGTSIDVVDSIYELEALFVEQQYQWLPISPPSEDVYVHSVKTALPVDWTKFPKTFTSQMYAEMDANGYPIYRVSVYEDPSVYPRERVFLNSYGTEVYRLPVENYDPYSWQTLHFQLEEGEELDEFNRWIFDPAHIAADFALLPELFYADYAETQEAQALESMAIAPMAMLMALPESPTNLVVAINSTTNTNSVVEIEIGYPETFTNRVEVYATTNLTEGEWTIVSSALATTGSTTVVWADTQTNLQFRAYRVGNADLDTDGDGLVDAREVLLYKTDRFSSDSDGDFMDDAWELQYALDPNDDLDMILDPDHDMLPNVYECYYGLNPNSSDSSSITKLRVDPAHAGNSNTYATILGAFNASTNYSIIEMAPGLYIGGANVGLNFPNHPIMLMSDNWGTNRTVEVRSSGFAAFFLSERQDNRTIIRGLNIKQTQGWRSMQMGFYLGHGSGPFYGAAPYFDGVRVDLGDSDWNVGFYGLGSSDKTVRFNNCIIRGANGDHVQSGIYLVDSPKVHVANCSFLNFNSSTNISHGILFGTSSINLGNAPASIDVRIENCFWDQSFATNSNYAVAHASDSTGRYSTEILSAIVPNTAYLLDVDSADGVIQTNGVALRDGLILSNSPCINACTTSTLSWYDFHGQPRDAAPDMGADEYSPVSTNDYDADGLTDYEEAFEYLTSIFDYDSDEDGVGDGDEVLCGTSPTNIENYCVTILGEVDNQTGMSAMIRASYTLGMAGWSASNSTVVSDGQFRYPHQIINSPLPPVIQVLVDVDGDNAFDWGEPFYTSTLDITNHDSGISFTLFDNDGDNVPDADEVSCGTDPNHPLHYCVSLQGTVTNLSSLTGTVYAAAVLMDFSIPPTPWDIVQGKVEKTVLQQVVVTNGTFLIDPVVVDQRTSNEVWSLWLELYQDIATNGALDFFEPMTQLVVSVTNHTMDYDLELPMSIYDGDYDRIPDWWEYLNGLSYTNAADAFADPDGDWIDNLWEYKLGTDLYAYNTNNYAFADAMRAVDTRLIGKSPSNSIEILSTYDNTTPEYIRNTNCWAADIDLTMCSPWNSFDSYKRAGTLISPRHALFVNHIFALPPGGFFNVPPGETLRFVDATNGVYIATIESIHNIDTNHADLTVAVLSQDVPTNRFSFVKILPDNYTNYLGQVNIHVPGLCLDQKERALIHDLYSVRSITATNISFIAGDCSYSLPIYGSRTNYYDSSIDGLGGPGMRKFDSGNPGFIILNHEPILTTLWVYPHGGSGTSIVNFKGEINDVMSLTGYTLSTIDLSDLGYQEIPESLR